MKLNDKAISTDFFPQLLFYQTWNRSLKIFLVCAVIKANQKVNVNLLTFTKLLDELEQF